MAPEDPEDKVQQSGEQLIQRIRQHAEQEVRGFVSELLTTTAKERAAALEDDRIAAERGRQQELRDQGGRIRAEVEKTWAAKLREANEAAKLRLESGLKAAREDADRQLAEKVASVRAEGQRDLAAAVEAARRDGDRTLALRIDDVRADAERTMVAELAAGPVHALGSEEPQSDEILARVLDGVRRLDQASRLTDVLDTLVELAGNEASRAAVLTVQADHIHGWRFIGFDSTLDDASQVDLECGEAGIVGRAVETGAACSVVGGPDGEPEEAEPAFAALPTGAHALAVPVLVGGRVMAVVYGDDAERRSAAAWRESLEVLACHAGQCLEALTAVRTAQLALQDIQSLIPGDAGPTLPFDEARIEHLEPEA